MADSGNGGADARGAAPSTVDAARVEAAVRELLAAIGEDPNRAALRETPRRVAEAYGEFFSGIAVDPATFLRDAVELASDEQGELVVVRDIEFRSMCEHHLLPFLGVAHVGYIPRAKVVGLGRLPRVIDALASRPQLQERLTEQIAEALASGLDARGVLVVLEASHGCVSARGVRQAHSSTVTVSATGELAQPEQRAAVMSLIGRGEGSHA